MSRSLAAQCQPDTRLVPSCCTRETVPSDRLTLLARAVHVHRVRFQSTSQPAPAAKASALIDALPGNSLVSKTGIVTLTAATTAVSNELFVLNEEVVILGSFAIFLGYVSSLVREPYREWADGQIQVRTSP